MPRYALYYAPDPKSALWRFGCETLGYDAATGWESPPKAPLDGTDWPSLTKEPRKYGFHATLKAPFHLAKERLETELTAALEAFAERAICVTLAGIEVSLIDGFCALTPTGGTTHLGALASEVVTAFENFRAPLTKEERERRLRTPLRRRQIEYLDAFGYPYVQDEFRFHMTLTGALPAAVREPVLKAMQDAYARSVPAGQVTLDGIALFKQNSAQDNFAVIARSPFKVRPS